MQDATDSGKYQMQVLDSLTYGPNNTNNNRTHVHCALCTVRRAIKRRRTRITHLRTNRIRYHHQAQPERRTRDRLIFFYFEQSYLFATDTLIRQSKKARCARFALTESHVLVRLEECGVRKMSGRLVACIGLSQFCSVCRTKWQPLNSETGVHINMYCRASARNQVSQNRFDFFSCSSPEAHAFAAESIDQRQLIIHSQCDGTLSFAHRQLPWEKTTRLQHCIWTSNNKLLCVRRTACW